MKGYLVQCVYGGYLMPGRNPGYTRYRKKARVFKRKPTVYADERIVEVKP